MGHSVLVLVWALAGEAATREPCAATEMWASLAGEVPDTKANRQLRHRIARELTKAGRADLEVRESKATRRCLAAVSVYGDVAWRYFGDTRRGWTELERANAASATLRLRLMDVADTLVLMPANPQELWDERHRRLVTHTTISGLVTGAALLTATIPWLVLAASRCEGKCGEALGEALTTSVAVPIGTASAIALVVWSTRLARHRRAPPPGITWPGRGLYLTTTPTGLRLRF